MSVEGLSLKIQSSYQKTKGTPLEPIERQEDQTLDEVKLVQHIKGKIDLVRVTNSRIAIEGIYMTNLAYLMGFDGVYYDATYRMFKNIDPKRKVTRSRFKVNKILPTIQNRLSRLTQSPPRYDVRPNSSSAEDKDCARLGVKIIEDVLEKNRFDELRQDLLMACMQGGDAYVQVCWDPCAGQPMIDPETEELVGYEGDIRLDVLNCLEVYPDPLAKKFEDCQYWIKAKVRKLEYFREHYPERGQAVKEEDVWLLSSMYDMKANALTAVGITGAQTQDQSRDSAIELVYYEKRSKKYPKGRMVVCANGILLEDKELPIGMFDCAKFSDMIIGGRYNSEAVITHLRPIQDQYNITRSRAADWIRKNMAGKYMVAKGAELMEESINNAESEVVEYTPVPNAPPPTAMQIPQIPPYVYKDLETQSSEFDFISGINEVSRGVLPSASMPAAGMAFLQEQDQTRIGVMTSRNEIGYAKIGEFILRYAGCYYEMPRMLKEAGDGLEYTVREFIGQDLKDNYDVIVKPGSTVPNSKVLKRQDILNAYSMGILGNPQDDLLKMKVLEMTEFGDSQEMWKKQALTLQRVNKNLAMIEQGQMPELSEFDMHKYHLWKMDEYRLSDKYQKLDDDRRQLFDFVMEWHVQALVNLQNPAVAQQKMMAEIAMSKNPQIHAQIQHALDHMHPGSPLNQEGGAQPGMPPAAMINNQGQSMGPMPPQSPNQQSPPI